MLSCPSCHTAFPHSSKLPEHTCDFHEDSSTDEHKEFSSINEKVSKDPAETHKALFKVLQEHNVSFDAQKQIIDICNDFIYKHIPPDVLQEEIV
ncbi:hypothetical protein A0J61_01959 [Choanephora cucurbitarum]|uniref:C2H2-type domain-containing protein n=1 Tax=Choanephora cucurbitarum TaxID=101091 RepID=A0A1C7NRV3_9FUNG|nr:hypothetical protein A0J61_01959 [Choanephora cucurbitarum]